MSNIMSRTVRKAKHFFLALEKLDKVQQKLLLKNATKQQTLALRELITNLLAGNIPIVSTSFKLLSKHKQLFRKFVKKNLTKSLLQKYSNVIVQFIKLIRSFLEAI